MKEVINIKEYNKRYRPRIINNVVIGNVYGDRKVIGLFNKGYRKYIKTQCVVCGREADYRDDSFLTGRCWNHSDCRYLLDKDSFSKKFYDCWRNMRMRTTNPNATEHERYYDRGISSEDFKNFVDFYDILYPSYIAHSKIYGEENTTLERKDSNGDYTLDNITWASRKIQNNNLTTSLEYTLDYFEINHTLIFSCFKEMQEYLGISIFTIRKYISAEKVLEDYFGKYIIRATHKYN